MKTRSAFEWYSVLVCLITLPLMIFLLGKVLMSTYYYLNPEESVHSSITIESQEPMKFKLPGNCEFVPDTPEEHYAKQVKMYNFYLKDAAQQNLHVIRSYSLYLILLILTFFGHFVSARNINAKNT